jgi:Flp pilus assembly protein TadG
MQNIHHGGRVHQAQRGATLVMVALSLVILLGICALAIDLASLYVGRSEAQRAADAAALAGADVFVTSGYSSGLVTQATVQTMAANAASTVGNKNLVGGKSPNIGTTFDSSCPPASATSDGCFNFSISGDPRITVVARQTMPTFFVKIFGVTSAKVSAQATAEAYNPSGGGPPVGTKCLKPWILPNCDPTHTNPLLVNPSCAPGVGDYFYNATLCANTSVPGICFPGAAPSGVIGTQLTLKVGQPNLAPAPGQFYPVDLPAGSTPSLCPSKSAISCRNIGGGSQCTGGSAYRDNIACCNTNPIVCGNVNVAWETGNMQGPTKDGTECLIHASTEGPNKGQDSITFDSTTGFTMTGGQNNPDGLSGKTVTSSDSIVTVPLYNGTTPTPGKGGTCSTGSVSIVGFLQVFINQVTDKNDPVCPLCVKATVMGVSGCGGGGGGGTPVSSGGSSPIPVRLVQSGN